MAKMRKNLRIYSGVHLYFEVHSKVRWPENLARARDGMSDGSIKFS